MTARIIAIVGGSIAAVAAIYLAGLYLGRNSGNPGDDDGRD